MPTSGSRVPPDKIDIYSDGCWLGVDHRNKIKAGGWGAVIQEHRGDKSTIRLLKGPVVIDNGASQKAETHGAFMGLKDVCKDYDLRDPDVGFPSIVLHMDEADIVRALQNKDKHLKLRADQYAKTYGPELEELTALMHVTGATVNLCLGSHARKIPDHIKTPRDCATAAHNLAKRAAWINRLEQQGFIINTDGRRLNGISAMNFIEDDAIISPPNDKKVRK